MNMQSTEGKKRPGWVWAISIFYFLSAVYTLLSFYLVFSGKVPVGPAEKAYIDSLTTIDFLLTIALGVSNLTGASLLFLLRKESFYFLGFPFVFGVLMTIWHTITKGFAAAAGGSGIVGMFLGWGMIIAVLWYIKKLEKDGIVS